MRSISIAISMLCLFRLPIPAQTQRSPIYKITVVQRSITAISYGHRAASTKIDFKGTVLSPKAQGEATVQSSQGAVKVNAKFQHLDAPAKFGPQYLTYVLWAITPDGHANNLGEIVTDSSDNGKLAVTTHFQAFGLIVTAEPYFSVTEPSDLVVLENAVRPNTQGKVEEVQAKYQLLPRGEYTLNIGAPENAPSGPMVSMDEYNALLALYEARNAVQIARSAQADLYAPDVFQKAQELLDQAQSYKTQKDGSKKVITTAREAAERAEDARLIATKKKAEQQAAPKRQTAE